INGEPGGSGEEDGEEDEDGDGGEDRQEDEDVGSMEHRAATDNDMAWVDTFILNTRRTGGRQTETSVLKMYKAWLAGALRAGVVPDAVVDANHKIHYLKYAATRCLLTKRGKEQETDESANFDVTTGTILEYQLRPEQFMEVTAAIFDMDQGTSVFCTRTSPSDLLPSIIKSLFAWNWQSATLNRGDELVNLPLAFLQPYGIRLADFDRSNGWPAGKNEPTYNFVVPHRDPLRCAVGSLTIMFHYMFDQGDLVSKIPDWDWADASLWREVCEDPVAKVVHLMFGRTVNKPMTGNGLCKMYKAFLDATSVNSNKKAHLARRAVPTIMEDMGVSADHIDAVGHWVGNAVTALAGFYVGETYRVPWAEVPVPDSLTRQVFPFVEEALASLRARGCQNQGSINFLELLRELRPFFWRVMAAIHARFPNSGVVKRIQIVHHVGAQQFFSQWPDVVRAADGVCNADIQLS
ncbi:hypothetical protein EDB85DRAFT_1819778, partial [Lactarius pseudohatsudake]